MLAETFAAVRRAFDELLGFLLVSFALGLLVRYTAAQAARRTGETELETRTQERISSSTRRHTQRHI